MKINIRLAIDASDVSKEDRSWITDKLNMLMKAKVIDSVEAKPNGAIVAKAELRS